MKDGEPTAAAAETMAQLMKAHQELSALLLLPRSASFRVIIFLRLFVLSVCRRLNVIFRSMACFLSKRLERERKMSFPDL